MKPKKNKKHYVTTVKRLTKEKKSFILITLF